MNFAQATNNGSILRFSVLISVLVAAAGCTEVTPDGPGSINAQCQVTATAEFTCDDGLDDDCDGTIDCADLDCAGNPVCSNDPAGNPGASSCEAEFPGGTLAIPDGVGNSYETSVTISGLPAGLTLASGSGLETICVDMEHSWLRDLEIELECPNGQIAVLQEFLGQVGGTLQMGVPDDDDGINPIPGTPGYYCWTMSASNSTMLDWGDQNPLTSKLPEGDYQPSESFDNLAGCELNGTWTIRATDDWAIDNGYIFGWAITFAQDAIGDCSGIVVE